MQRSARIKANAPHCKGFLLTGLRVMRLFRGSHREMFSVAADEGHGIAIASNIKTGFACAWWPKRTVLVAFDKPSPLGVLAILNVDRLPGFLEYLFDVRLFASIERCISKCCCDFSTRQFDGISLNC
jgi:hypothetical protein